MWLDLYNLHTWNAYKKLTQLILLFSDTATPKVYFSQVCSIGHFGDYSSEICLNSSRSCYSQALIKILQPF